MDAASRRAKGGKYSRTLPSAIDGFIHELSRQLCGGIACGHSYPRLAAPRIKQNSYLSGAAFPVILN
jgi:hypothetical protein